MKCVQRPNGDAESHGKGGHFRQRQSTETDRQGSKHQNVASVGECRIPTQDGEETRYEHRSGNQEVLLTPKYGLQNLRREPTAIEKRRAEPLNGAE